MSFGQGTDQNVWENQQQINVNELRLGHYVAKLSSPWHETPFLIQGFVVGDADERQWIVEHCDWVVIDIRKSRDNVELLHAFKGARKVRPEAKVLRSKPLTQKSMKASLNSYLELSAHAVRITEHFKHLGQGEVRSSIVTVKEIAAQLMDNLPALIWLTRIKHGDKYTAEHCLNVCILAMGLATSLSWDPRRIAQVGVAGLLHDLGKIDIDKDLLNKPGKLSPEEFDILKTHPMNGFERLKGEPGLTDSILNGIKHHHERPDGHGYPAGQKGDQIDEMAKVVSIADAYDAITSNRVYQKARSHHEAMGILWRMKNSQFDSTMVDAFIQFLGWVTPGTLVELTSGDLAVVLQAVEGHRLYPKVRVLMPTNMGYTLGAKWDLSTMQGSEGEVRIHIANVMPDGHLGIHLEDFANRLFD